MNIEGQTATSRKGYIRHALGALCALGGFRFLGLGGTRLLATSSPLKKDKGPVAKVSP
jgi:hypothetical protein